MALISADDNFKCIFLNKNDRIQIRILLEFVLRNPIDNQPALVWVKPLPETMLTQLTDTYMQH